MMRPTSPLAIALTLAIASAGACTELGDEAPPPQEQPPEEPRPPGEPPPPEVPTHLDYLRGFPTGEDQRAITCGRGNADRFATWYCAAGGAPSITRLEDLIMGLGLGAPNQRLFAFTGHSSSLVVRKTSSLNPRSIIFSPDNTPDYATIGFVRGDQFAEIAAFDRTNNRLNFYLVRFTRPCDPDCSNAEKYTAAIESGWTSVSAYGDEDLKNTALDCRQCHQPGGANSPAILRMHELRSPWTHFFRNNRNSRVLMDDFLRAHPGEDYGGIPANRIRDSDPADLEDLVRAAGFGNQPNEFRGNNINNDNVNVTTPNTTWLNLYDRSVRGLEIAVPYFGIDPFDPAKVDAAVAGYRAVVTGQAAPETMPNMADLFRADALAHLGFVAAEGLDAKGIIEHRCGTCHDGRFPGISRDNFRVSDFPDNLTPEMAARIRERMELPDTHHLKMPPVVFSHLTEAQKAMVLGAL